MPALNLRRLPLWRFSLRTLLIVVTAIAVWMGMYLHTAKEQHAAVAEIRRYGGWVRYDYQLDDGKFNSLNKSWVPDWMPTQLGDDMFHNVVEVNLSYSEDHGGRADNKNLAEAPLECLAAFPKLTGLFLHQTQASDANLQYVGKLRHLDCLVIWDAAKLTDAGVAKLQGLANLKSLHISDSQITDESLRVLARMPGLEVLSLQFNRFTDAGVSELRALRRLKELWVCGRSDRPNEITDASLEFLFDLPEVTELGVQHTKVSKEFTARLKGKFPKCSISQTP